MSLPPLITQQHTVNRSFILPANYTCCASYNVLHIWSLYSIRMECVCKVFVPDYNLITVTVSSDISLKQFPHEIFQNGHKTFSTWEHTVFFLLLSLTRSSHLQCNYILMRMTVTKWYCGLCKSPFLAPWVIKKWKEYDCWVKMIK